MKPQGVLTEQDYQMLASNLIDYHDPGNFLDGCERDYLATNRDFWQLLEKMLISLKMSEEQRKEFEKDGFFLTPRNNEKIENLAEMVRQRIAHEKSKAPFDINNLQFVVKSEQLATQILAGKTPYIVCCRVTQTCLEGLVYYKPTEDEFTLFAQSFSWPHRFGLDVNLPKIIKDPEKMEYYFQKMEEKIQELSRKDLREYFFRCAEIDVNWDYFKDTTGEARLGFLKFGERLEKVKQKVISQKNVEKVESESKYAGIAIFNPKDHHLESQFSRHEPTPTGATTKVKLPTLEDAMKNPKMLPTLWKRLSEMDKPFVDEGGKILGGRKARKHREVMALAQVVYKLFKEGYGIFDIYSMLCIEVELDESERPDKIQNRPGYDDIRLAILSELKDLLK